MTKKEDDEGAWLAEIRDAVKKADTSAASRRAQQEQERRTVAEEFVANKNHLKDVVAPVLARAAQELAGAGRPAYAITLGGVDLALADVVECSLVIEGPDAKRHLSFSARRDSSNIQVSSSGRATRLNRGTRDSLTTDTVKAMVLDFVKSVVV